MDLVLKLHPETERILIETQKKIIYTLNKSKSKTIAFPFYPIYVPLSGIALKNQDIQSAKNKMKKITLTKIYTKEKQIFCAVTVVLDDNTIEEENILLGTTTEDLKIEEDFFSEPKSFMLCEMTKEGYVTSFWNNKWIKKI